MLTLYTKGSCPFSLKVLAFAERSGIKLETRDIYTDPSVASELIVRGGKRQVPYLVDEEKGVAMYESEDIISYLGEKYAG